jgi:hypothetical protein
MSTKPFVRPIGILAAVLTLASPATAQGVSPTLLGLGSGFILTRPNDHKLWGVHGRLQSYLAPAAIVRGVATLEFLRSDWSVTPVIASVGGELGVSIPGRGGGVTSPLTLGLAMFYYGAGSDVITDCRSDGRCEQRNMGYDLGFMLAATATWGLEYRVGAESLFYTDFRLYLPSGLGSNGYAGDPSAAFVGFSMGFLLAP